MMKEVYRTAKPGARFCIRELLSSQRIPSELTSNFKRNSKLEKQLEEKDRCFIYRFMTGSVEK